MKQIRLIALDLDGTLFNPESRINERNLAVIKKMKEQGVHVVIASGRPYAGLPLEQLQGTGIEYAITTNGSSIYELESEKCIHDKCIFEDPLENDTALSLLDYLLTKDIHLDIFMGGVGYSPLQCVSAGEKLPLPPTIKNYITKSRIRIADMHGFIRSNHLRVQKMTLNFYPDENGILKNREEIRIRLETEPGITCVSGGFNNLEFTKRGVTKGTALLRLAQKLCIDPAATMAIGDSENDLSMIRAAGIGVAMGNASDPVKECASYITGTNAEDGVASAIERFTAPAAASRSASDSPRSHQPAFCPSAVPW